MRKYLILLFLLTSFGVLANAQSKDDIAVGLEKIMKAHNGVGMSVAVIKGNKLVYSQSFGLKDIEQNIPVNNTDIFRIASISKSFAATAIMQLIEQGKFSLDSDFSDLIGFKVRNPNFPDKVITLRMVLSHTSSLNDSQGYFNFDSINPSKNNQYEKNFNQYEPGTAYQYCNLNYNMVGAVVERYSGKRYDTYIKENILDPLKIYGGYDVDLLDRQKFVKLYTWNKEFNKFEEGNAYPSRAAEISKHILGYTTPIFSPTGGMKISAGDLAVYMQMHMNFGKSSNQRIISKKSSLEMQKPLSKEENYGLALLNTEQLITGKNMVGHTGSAYGLYSSMFFNPKEKFGFVVLTNGSDGKSKDGQIEITTKVIRHLYDTLIK